jgi:type VI secretion system protein ImpB
MLRRAITDEIPKSRITLTYRTNVDGQKTQDVQLPFRVLVMGNLTGSSKDERKDLDKRTISSLNGQNLDDVMKHMGMTLKLTVPNRTGGEEPTQDISLAIDRMKSFSPADIAEKVPQLKKLLTLKKLLLEAQSNLDNNKDFRKKLRELSPAEITALQSSLSDYAHYKLPPAPPKKAKSPGDQNEDEG